MLKKTKTPKEIFRSKPKNVYGKILWSIDAKNFLLEKGLPVKFLIIKRYKIQNNRNKIKSLVDFIN